MIQFELEGTPRQIGNAHGESFRKKIHELAQIRRGLLRKFLKDFQLMELEKLVFNSVLYLQKYPELFEEFIGIAESALISVSDLMILNNYTDLKDFHNLKSSAHPSGSVPKGCSVFSYRTSAHYFCGQTWDMHASAKDYAIHLTLRKPKGMDGSGVSKIEIFTVTGCLALSGVNDRGVAVLINNLHSTETQIGLMWPGLVRAMLERPSASEAAQYLCKNLPCSGHNYMICDPHETINIETTGRRYEVTEERKGSFFTFHTNHYLGGLKETENKMEKSITTEQRLQDFRKYSETIDLVASQIQRSTFALDLLAGRGAPSLSIPPTSDLNASATCGGIYLDLQSREGETFEGLYQNQDHYLFKI